MIRDITIGQYYPEDSLIHKLDPRTKIFGTFIFILTLFIFNSFLGYFLAFLALSTVIIISKVPAKFMLKGIKGILIIIIFTAIINTFTTKGNTVIAKLWTFTITLEGVIIAAKMIIRLMLLITGSSVLTLTTTPIELTDGIEYILDPFKKIGVPSHEIAMMMTIALRFIPTLLDETDKIIKAQQARGADFETGNIIKRAKGLVPIMVPLFISAFRRADELALAMEARCYHGGENRTRMNKMSMKAMDFTAIFIFLLYIVSAILIRVYVKVI